MEFRTRPLSDFATFASGGTPAKGRAEYWNGSIPWLTPKDMSSFDGTTQDVVTEIAIGNGTRIAPQNSLFVAVRGMSLHNEIRIVRPCVRMSFNQDIKAIIPKSTVDERFLYFAMQAKVSDLLAAVESAGHGTGRLPTDKLQGLPIPDVSLSEQRAIASILGALDDKIELNRRMNETLEAMARAIFKDWFVDFGPTRAKMAMRGEDPQNENIARAPYLAPDSWSLFPDCLDADGKPQGWEVVPLATLIEINPSEQLARGKSAPYLDMASIPTAGPNPEPYVVREFGSGMRFRNGDALLARITPCLENGKTAFVQNLPDDEVGWGSTEFIVLRSRPPLPKAVAYLIARDPVFRANAIRSMTGTSGRQRASNDAISAYLLTQPENDILWTHLNNLIAPMFERVAANDRENKSLAATRDMLLPKLMSGEVRVKDAERQVGEAT